MNIEIKKLTIDLLDDWLYFFDKVAFCDNGEWAGCYCMCYHWTKELAKKRSWAYSAEDAPYNRKCAIDFIKNDKMHGYLAYLDGNVAGWCNADAKQSYENVNYDLSADEELKKYKIKSVVCFCIAPDQRGKGIASRLLDRVCEDAAQEGYDFVEAYPFENNANKDYHGPQSMYEKKGFEHVSKIGICSIMRKAL